MCITDKRSIEDTRIKMLRSPNCTPILNDGTGDTWYPMYLKLRRILRVYFKMTALFHLYVQFKLNKFAQNRAKPFSMSNEFLKVNKLIELN